MPAFFADLYCIGHSRPHGKSSGERVQRHALTSRIQALNTFVVHWFVLGLLSFEIALTFGIASLLTEYIRVRSSPHKGCARADVSCQ